MEGTKQIGLISWLVSDWVIKEHKTIALVDGNKGRNTIALN